MVPRFVLPRFAFAGKMGVCHCEMEIIRGRFLLAPRKCTSVVLEGDSGLEAYWEHLTLHAARNISELKELLR